MKKYAANILSLLRITLSLALIFAKPLSVWFYAIYLLCGLSDMTDGTVARRLGSESELGARLDSIGDIVFAAVCLVKLLPVMPIGTWLWIWLGAIALLRLINIISGLKIKKRAVMLHTRLNKITGTAVFLLPLTLGFADINVSAIPVCVLATLAAMDEGYRIRTLCVEDS